MHNLIPVSNKNNFNISAERFEIRWFDAVRNENDYGSALQ